MMPNPTQPESSRFQNSAENSKPKIKKSQLYSQPNNRVVFDLKIQTHILKNWTKNRYKVIKLDINLH